MGSNTAAIVSAIRDVTCVSSDRLSESACASLARACYGLSGADMIRALHNKLRQFETLDDNFSDVHKLIDDLAASTEKIGQSASQPAIQRLSRSVVDPAAALAMVDYLERNPETDIDHLARRLETSARTLRGFKQTGKIGRLLYRGLVEIIKYPLP